MARENADPDDKPLEKPIYHVPTKAFKEGYDKINWNRKEKKDEGK